MEEIDKVLEKQADALSDEDRGKIYEEMDELIMKSKTPDKLDFSVKSGKFGIFFPLMIIFSLFLLLGSSTYGTWLYSLWSESQFLQNQDNVEEARTLLAQAIIDENKKRIAATERKLGSIQIQLSTALKARENIQAEFDLKLEQYKTELEQRLANRQSSLRRDLELQQLNEEEIERRLAEQKEVLTEEYDAELERFTASQKNQQERLEAEYQVEISSLESQLQNQKQELTKLETTIASQEEKFTVIESQAQEELAATKQQLEELQKLSQEKDVQIRNFGQFDRVFNNLSTAIEREDYQKALEFATQGEELIKSSPYAQEEIAKIYSKTFSTERQLIEDLLETAVNAEKLVQEITNVRQNERIVEVEVPVPSGNDNELIETLKGQLEREESRVSRIQRELQIVQNNYNKSEAEILRLQRYQTTLQRKIKEQEAELTVASRRIASMSNEDYITNIQTIVVYLQNKKSGKTDDRVNSKVQQLIKAGSNYIAIGSMLAQEMGGVTFP